MASQKDPKIDLKSIKMGVKIEVDFYINFISIFHRFYLPKTIENETRNRHKTYPKCISVWNAFLNNFCDKT